MKPPICDIRSVNNSKIFVKKCQNCLWPLTTSISNNTLICYGSFFFALKYHFFHIKNTNLFQRLYLVAPSGVRGEAFLWVHIVAGSFLRVIYNKVFYVYLSVCWVYIKYTFIQLLYWVVLAKSGVKLHIICV